MSSKVAYLRRLGWEKFKGEDGLLGPLGLGQLVFDMHFEVDRCLSTYQFFFFSSGFASASGVVRHGPEIWTEDRKTQMPQR